MKMLQQVPSYLLALIFLVFGSNYFFNFLPMPPLAGDAGTFIGLLYSTGFLAFVKVLEVVVGLLLLIKPLRPLALLLIAPISLNILLFEVFISHQPGIGIALVLFNTIAIFQHKKNYLTIINA
jgi:putative oxidoreductase